MAGPSSDGLPIVAGPVRLRRFTVADAPRILALSQEAGVRRWIPDQVYADLTEAGAVLTELIGKYDSCSDPRRGPLVLAVDRIDDCGEARLVGHIGLSPWRGGVEIGYAVGEADQRQGIATAAVRAMLGWAFGRYRLPRVLGVVSVDNRPSARVLEKAGFARVSTEETVFHGELTWVHLYAVAAAGFGSAA